MRLPFTVDQVLQVFELYNTAFWPGQVFAYILGIAAIALAARSSRACDRLVSAILALFWLWTGIVYHMVYFSSINQAAWGFGALFVVQGIVLLLAGVITPSISYHFRLDTRGLLGGLLVLYAMLVYPLVGAALGHGYPRAPMFGVAPCPMTIFTLGLLLWARNGRPPMYVPAIPLVWSVIGFVAAVKLGIYEDTGLLASAFVAGIAMLWTKPQPEATSTPEA